ncbi:DUF3168 domain-containing protein (plasmid) [Skermanella rosea]|uniref:DUF3168 domain-containing protein n=1 Tax=Skermanella rosea TaxID=1817965 RepID=UPI001931BBE3|nr:DUF3168 domain-containing protein [Skermanella rosea]UEM08066.1 DUF3168 domain-containing protein [Skermanella rosea]
MALDTAALLAGIYARLDAQLTTPVYSHVPQGQAYPYVRFGDIAMDDASAKDIELHEWEMQIHAFSRSKESAAEVLGILKNIYAALHNQEAAITVSGGTLVMIRCEFQTHFQERQPNETYWHGVQRYRAITQDI